jgi:hypothetical protein
MSMVLAAANLRGGCGADEYKRTADLPLTSPTVAACGLAVRDRQHLVGAIDHELAVDHEVSDHAEVARVAS